jgi:enterochelin esterase-like enzyme
VLTFLCRSKAEIVRVAGSIQMPMSHIEGTDLWVLQLRMPDWDAMRVKYKFYTTDDPGEIRYWQGAKGPAEVVMAEPLKGRLVERSFTSKVLGEERKFTVYLPPNAPTHDLPAFFMADGQSCEPFAKALEPLILAKKIRPVAIVGVHNGNRGPAGLPPSGENFRAKEYVPGADPERFAKHLEFFADEVTAWAAKEFGISTKREDRAIFGYSDGGSFSATAAITRPEVFGAAVPLSPGIPPKVGKPAAPLPAFYFAAGRLERFSIPTEMIYRTVLDWGAKASLKTYFSGHDEGTWLTGLVEYAPLIFPYQPPAG